MNNKENKKSKIIKRRHNTSNKIPNIYLNIENLPNTKDKKYVSSFDLKNFLCEKFYKRLEKEKRKFDNELLKKTECEKEIEKKFRNPLQRYLNKGFNENVITVAMGQITNLKEDWKKHFSPNKATRLISLDLLRKDQKLSKLFFGPEKEKIELIEKPSEFNSSPSLDLTSNRGSEDNPFFKDLQEEFSVNLHLFDLKGFGLEVEKEQIYLESDQIKENLQGEPSNQFLPLHQEIESSEWLVLENVIQLELGEIKIIEKRKKEEKVTKKTQKRPSKRPKKAPSKKLKDPIPNIPQKKPEKRITEMEKEKVDSIPLTIENSPEIAFDPIWEKNWGNDSVQFSLRSSNLLGVEFDLSNLLESDPFYSLNQETNHDWFQLDQSTPLSLDLDEFDLFSYSVN